MRRRGVEVGNMNVRTAATIRRPREEVETRWRAFATQPEFTHDVRSVVVTDAPADQGTELHVEVEVKPPLGPLGALATRLYAIRQRDQISNDVRRFKQLLETGEVSTS
jgi:uncharacterized membrane protein